MTFVETVLVYLFMNFALNTYYEPIIILGAGRIFFNQYNSVRIYQQQNVQILNV